MCVQYSFENSKLKILEIESFKMTITMDKELLQPLYKHYLNPFEIELIGVKDLPVLTDKKYDQVYVQYSFFQNLSWQSTKKLAADKLKWAEKHVYLLGLMDQVKLMEFFRSSYIKM